MKWALLSLLNWVGLTSYQQPLDLFPSRIWLLEKTLENFDLPGGLPGLSVASPSQSFPDYYYHWIRDGALAIGTLVGQLERHNDEYSDQIRTIIESYIASSRQLQNVPNLSGNVGEPKFYIDGTPFNGPWGRPQNDGPALRVMALAKYARNLGPAQNKKLFKNVLEADLNYVLNVWQDSCFDLWEEVYGTHFFTVLSQYGAIKSGAALATLAGLNSHAATYSEALTKIEEFIVETFLGYTLLFEHSPIYLANRRGLDSASILAVTGLSALAGWTEQINGPLLINTTDPRLFNTMELLVTDFRVRYPINQANPGGIGRYPEDVYDGIGVSQGNPWFLTTAAMAEAFILCGDPDMAYPHMGFIAAHRAADSLSEQINRYTGYMQGAASLTWSYTQTLQLLDTVFEFNLNGQHPTQPVGPTYEPVPAWTWDPSDIA